MRKTIFLSASIPDPKRNPKYFDSADVTAIRDAVKALVSFALPNTNLVWGGHPAITPMIRVIAQSMSVNIKDRIWLYQSDYFSQFFITDNDAFENVIITPSGKDRDESLLIMRKQMFESHRFSAGIFIGGMEGVEEEFDMFKMMQHSAKLLPIASTGAAAKIIYDRYSSFDFSKQLEETRSYFSLFRRMLSENDLS